MIQRPKIDPEFKALLPPLSREEFSALDAKLVREGCTEPFPVWQEEGILLDGHNRLAICEAHDITYAIREVSFDNREDAVAWIEEHARARRNLSPDWISYLSGRDYHRGKMASGRPKKGSQFATLSEGPQKTAERLADERGVHVATIYRDAAFATAIDAITAIDPSTKQDILSGKLPLTREEVSQVAALEPSRLKRVLEKVRRGFRVGEVLASAAPTPPQPPAPSPTTTPPPAPAAPEYDPDAYHTDDDAPGDDDGQMPPPAAEEEEVPEAVLRAKALIDAGTHSQREAAAEVGLAESTLRCQLKRYAPLLNGAAHKPEATPAATTVADAPAPLLDAVGLPVPDHLRPVWEFREEFCKPLRSLYREAGKLIAAAVDHPGARDYRQQLSFRRRKDSEGNETAPRARCADLDNSLARLDSTEPYASACPWCQPLCEPPSKDCKACKGQGWVSRSSWFQAGEKLQQLTAGTHGKERGL